MAEEGIGVFTPRVVCCGFDPPGVTADCSLNEIGLHGHEPVAGLAGWLTLRRRAMDLVRLSFLFKKVAPVFTLR